MYHTHTPPTITCKPHIRTPITHTRTQSLLCCPQGRGDQDDRVAAHVQHRHVPLRFLHNKQATSTEGQREGTSEALTLMIVSSVSSSVSVDVSVSSTSPSTMFKCSSYACGEGGTGGGIRHQTHALVVGEGSGHARAVCP